MTGRFFIFFVLCSYINLFISQSNKLDSLLKLLKTARHDTTRFNAYLGLGNYFQKINPDSALVYHHQAKSLTDKNIGVEWDLRKSDVLRYLGWDYYLKGNYDLAIKNYKISEELADKYMKNEKEGVRTKALNIKSANLTNSGVIYLESSEYTKAINKFTSALKIKEFIGDKKGQSKNLTNLGIVYQEQGDFSKALEQYFKALKIKDEIGDIQGKTATLCNIGIIYLSQENFSKALEYFKIAQDIDIKTENKLGQSINLGNMGNVYSALKEYSKAMECYLSALKLDQEMGNKSGIARHLSNIGLIYSGQFNLEKKSGNKHSANDLANRALEFYFKSIKINDEIGNKRDLAINLYNVGSIYLLLEKYPKAQYYLLESEKLLRNINNNFYLKDVLLSMSELSEQTGRYKDALLYYEEYIKARDTVLSEENSKAAVVKEMKYNYEKEHALKEKEHQKQLAIEKEKQEKQKLVTGFIIAGLILVVLFSGFIVNRLQVTRKQKRIIEKQKQLVEEQKKTVEEQKLIVEQKNKDITDSIKYSKRIQDAILPHPRKWKEHLPDSFILYLPKDIVAGDFYWMEVSDKYVYVAAADCTGHGVPGAMVSVVCSNALTKAVLEEKITNTDEILNRVREIVIEKLTSEENIRDGIDICLVRLTKGNKEIQYSGANRPLYMVQDGVLTEYKPDKQPIGRYEEIKSFSKQDIVLQKSSMLYLTTDGYADQFGGEKGKKIGTKAFKELLVKISGISETEKQREEMITYFRQWKGSEEQMDDVTVLGIKIA